MNPTMIHNAVANDAAAGGAALAAPAGHTQVRGWLIRPVSVIFYTVFVFLYFLSGLLMVLDSIPYRMGLVSLLVLPLFVIYGIKIDKVTLAFIALVLVATFSAWANRSAPREYLLFLRIPVFAYLIYYLVERFVRPHNYRRIITLCLFVATIQLPVVVMQQTFYDQLPETFRNDDGRVITQLDIGFGTFRVGDSALGFFLNLLIIFLLFCPKYSYFVKRKIPLVLWFSLTILICRSNMSILSMLTIWAAYFALRLNRKLALRLLLLAIVGVGVLVASGLMSEFTEELANRLDDLPRSYNEYEEAKYLRGDYARMGAIYFITHHELLWYGDGPSKYTDPVTRERVRGNVGHFFTFYTEIGLLGWLASVAIFALIAFRVHKYRMPLSWAIVLTFVTMQMLSFVNQALNDISVMMIYCIMLKIYSFPPRAVLPAAPALIAGHRHQRVPSPASAINSEYLNNRAP